MTKSAGMHVDLGSFILSGSEKSRLEGEIKDALEGCESVHDVRTKIPPIVKDLDEVAASMIVHLALSVWRGSK
jgi:hypothetical protein